MTGTAPFPPDAFGITSSIPIEIPLAAGRRVLDLNNRFVLAAQAGQFVRLAERDGYPRTCCAWIRGLYGLIRSTGVRRVIFVTGGDCSNTHAMMETLARDLDELQTFAYPASRDAGDLSRELDRFCQAFGVSRATAEEAGKRLEPIRRSLAELDRLTWQEGTVTGAENHLWLVSSSDFNGDPVLFGHQLDAFLDRVRSRKPAPTAGPRLGILGVPPIQTDLLDLLERLGARIVYNEIPRQFAMIGPAPDLVSRYIAFTYPYGGAPRMDDIAAETERRRIDGLVHYTQAFCHRQIHDILLRQKLGIPILTIEGDAPGPCDARTRLRLESFIEILQERRT
ncbi:MAG TPA: 2-hydroxyacyl-CoA dehydratase [Candidatus Ozemobacteraceae bacterium]|nr:2-hydroxyacyl-CoA dehydratase [Candidatus Ozemobacteraceae bacterium]